MRHDSTLLHRQFFCCVLCGGHAGRTAQALARVVLVVCLVLTASAGVRAQDEQPDDEREEDKTVKATVRQIRDSWLSVDTALTGKYAGVDSALGPLYHVIEVDEVWMGAPQSGRLVFKAPRGVGVDPGDEALFMLWDRLNGATDSYLENATRLHGDDAWRLVGPDSVATLLLPFSRYAYRFDGKHIRLRGTSVYRNDMKRSELHGLLLDYELTLLPKALFEQSDLVVRARVSKVDKRKREIEEIVTEFRIYVDFEVLGMLKGEPPGALRLEYSSFPRSPRFDLDEHVILFLREVDERFYLPHGKRGVYHIIEGAVAETDQPLPEFVRSLQGESD